MKCLLLQSLVEENFDIITLEQRILKSSVFDIKKLSYEIINDPTIDISHLYRLLCSLYSTEKTVFFNKNFWKELLSTLESNNKIVNKEEYPKIYLVLIIIMMHIGEIKSAKEAFVRCNFSNIPDSYRSEYNCCIIFLSILDKKHSISIDMIESDIASSKLEKNYFYPDFIFSVGFYYLTKKSYHKAIYYFNDSYKRSSNLKKESTRYFSGVLLIIAYGIIGDRKNSELLYNYLSVIDTPNIATIKYRYDYAYGISLLWLGNEKEADFYLTRYSKNRRNKSIIWREIFINHALLYIEAKKPKIEIKDKIMKKYKKINIDSSWIAPLVEPIIPLRDCERDVSVLGLLVKDSFDISVNERRALIKFKEHNSLSKRETEILYYIIKGESINSISINLDIKKNTVNSHIHRIYKKSRVNTRSQLVNLYRMDIDNAE